MLVQLSVPGCEVKGMIRNGCNHEGDDRKTNLGA